MGSVWRAKHLGWKADVAVKLLAIPDTALARERFEREARLAAGLRSPHVVQVLESGVDEATRTPFLVMELLEGESVAARLARLGKLSPHEVLTITTHVSRALTRAHEAGIIHRDIKPDNIYLTANADEPFVKLLDFGVAKPIEYQMIEGRAVTADGTAVGTPWYQSPEQLRGLGTIDHRTDLWSLAVTVCECLTGRIPFEAKDFGALVMLICGEGPLPKPSVLGVVPTGFDEWFARATTREREDRFQSAGELVKALRGVCETAPREPIPPIVAKKDDARAVPSVPPISRTNAAASLPFLRSHPHLLALLCTGVALALGANAYLFIRHTSRPTLAAVPPVAVVVPAPEAAASVVPAVAVAPPVSATPAPIVPPFLPEPSASPPPPPEPSSALAPSEGSRKEEPSAPAPEPSPRRRPHSTPRKHSTQSSAHPTDDHVVDDQTTIRRELD